jgi:hypothetical protein
MDEVALEPRAAAAGFHAVFISAAHPEGSPYQKRARA